jgi:hypothetical protein
MKITVVGAAVIVAVIVLVLALRRSTPAQSAIATNRAPDGPA